MTTKGFTLVEHIIGAGIGLVIIGAALTAITDFMQSQNNSQKIYDTMLAADSIFTQLTQDIHQADFVTTNPNSLEISTFQPDASFTTITYTWEPVSPPQPDRYVIKRNGENIHSSKVMLIDKPLDTQDFYITTSQPDDKKKKDFTPPIPLVAIKLTIEHASRQGARTIYETLSKISLRNHNISI